MFQLESAGMRDLLKKIHPSEFEDVISILALYRPGPMGSGMLDDFIKRKRGEIEIKYDHPKLEPILKATYGIIVYQEQVMQIAVALAGFSLVQADHLRRAMSKKVASIMEQMRNNFVEGCGRVNQIDEKRANNLFDLIDYFSGYGFNRSHSAAYAIISYQTAYLKANYAVEFMCALLTSEKDNTDKIVEYVKESEAMGIKILPPHINASIKEFSVVDEKTIQFGFLAVKNVGSTAIESILANRQSGGVYLSLFDLCQRADLRLVNRKVLESLIKCGAMDCFGIFRSQLLGILEKALERGAKAQKDKASGQVSFFNMGDEDVGFKSDTAELPQIKEWPQNEILTYEKESLGFYVSGHPLAHYTTEIKEFTGFSMKKLPDLFDGEEVRLVALINQIKLTNTRKTNERMAILKVEDLDGEAEAVVFPSAYSSLAPLIIEGQVVFISGKVSRRDDQPKIMVSDIKAIQHIYQAIKTINVDLTRVEAHALEDLKIKLASFRGKVPVYLKLNTQNNKSVQIVVSEDLFVTPSEALMNEIKELLGKESFSVTF